MKFKSIDLINFRQFSGENKLEFSVENDKNLTIIHAMNGSGKTTLLQAFNWCLYGKLKLPEPEKLLNETLFQEMKSQEEKTVSVVLEAVHEDINYTIERKKIVKKMIDGNPRILKEYFSVVYTKENGNSVQELDASAENIINSILPEKLSNYFLFDGERIKNLGENTAQARKDISTGIKNILNIDVYDSLKTILERKVMNLLHSQLKSEASAELEAKKTECQVKTDELEAARRNIQLFENDIASLNEQIDRLEEKIKVNDQGVKLQDEYKDKEKRYNSLKAEINDMLFPGKKSHPSFSKHYTSYTISRLLSIMEDEVMLKLNSSTVEDEAIPGMNATAIDAILEKKICVCGRKITCNEVDKLNNLKQYLPPHDHRVLIHGFKTRYDEKTRNLDTLIAEKQDFIATYYLKDDEKLKLQEDIKRLDRQLENVQDIQHLYTEKKAKRGLLESKITQLALERVKAETLEQKLKDLEDEIELSTKNDKENQRIYRLIDYNKDLIKILSVTVDRKKKEIHEQLNQEVNNVFNNASHKKSKEVIIDENYNYKIRDKNTGSEALSEGESIITSLSLIAAILKIAKGQMIAKKDDLDAVVEYPLILDAPFAKLDTSHISGIAPLLPKFSDQVILFSIDQQFKGAVEESVKDVIGKQYEMINHEDKNVQFKEI